jgi:ATP-dependent HslUV protease ATP-binding subunit HslU
MKKPLTPSQTVDKLNKYVIGQDQAKRKVAIALRNRWRRLNVDALQQDEIKPNNILMIGPTGVGKTEIARRLALLVSAPFIKVEATKFTEVGYVGKDVESIIRDLMEHAIHIVRKAHMKQQAKKAQKAVEKKLLEIILPKVEEGDEEGLYAEYREKLAAGKLDDEMVEIALPQKQANLEILAPPGMEEMTNQLQGLFQSLGSPKKKKCKLPIGEAKIQLEESIMEELLDENLIKLEALELTENEGIVFLDEIDKLAKSKQHHGDVSREGVQRDLLPLVEGTVVHTKYGAIRTDHILFIASGAFMETSPNDLISELQGRFPIRAHLNALTANDLEAILTKTKFSLLKQFKALLETDDVDVNFSKEATKLMANIAFQLNEEKENLGARRLNQVIETVLENILFDAPFNKAEKINISLKHINDCFKSQLNQKDLSQWII